MSLPKSVRFDDELEKNIEAYLNANGLKFPQLMKMAVEKFISEPHTIRLRPVDKDEFLKNSKKAFGKHKDAMDKLK